MDTLTDPNTGTEYRMFPTPDPNLFRVQVWRGGKHLYTHVVGLTRDGGTKGRTYATIATY